MATANTGALRADEDRNAEILARIPAGRWATPEDIAGAVLYLASPASDYMHGAIIATSRAPGRSGRSGAPAAGALAAPRRARRGRRRSCARPAR
ncbi:SDR family oxidoreductase [Isoptericola sp. NPDC058082]|uniref:SDR family oxidoreductase n=1 Tax=Isoptericola sp. NPDC058082 TaxID=3346331 RepID=UPI0036F17661